MTVKEFASYFILNIHRATLSNALTISKKFQDPIQYDFKEFLSAVQQSAKEELGKKTITEDVCYAVYSISAQTLKKLNSTVKYNKNFIIDDFIILIWQLFDRG